MNVDIDGLHLYYRIHGLPEPPTDGPTVYETGVRRFLDLFRRHGVRATFFAVGEDLLDPRNRAVMEQAVAEGHEVASHSHTHPYDLSLQSAAHIERELEEAEEAIAAVQGGRRPTGFRAPGYNTSATMLATLARRGYLYDSSLFPCPPYYLAKAAIIGAYRLLGRPSRSVAGDPSVMWSPRTPFVHRLPDGPLVELPIAVLPGVRFPLIGTSLLMMGRKGWSLLRPLADRVPFMNIEFHAIDLTDHAGDGIDDALLRQPDQRVPLDAKLDTFDTVLAHVARGWDVLTLDTVARQELAANHDSAAAGWSEGASR